MLIAVVATGSRAAHDMTESVKTLAARTHPEAELWFHPAAALTSDHFAGPDPARAEAFLDAANDPAVDAVWFARGGYGSNRLIEYILPRLKPAASDKAYLGYSDAGFLLAALYRSGFPRVAHGPMVHDLNRDGGEAALRRSLDWLVRRNPAALEPSVRSGQGRAAAFNLTILAHLIGTPWLPDLSDHVLMVEEVSEPLYRIDRAFFQITACPMIRRVAGLRLGRCSQITPNQPEFGADELAIAIDWCARAGIAFLGRADIGHDIDNKVVPFG